MITRLASAAVLLGLTIVASGCAADIAPEQSFDAEQTDDNDSDLSTSSKSFVTLRHDDRKCVSPLCGGYFVKDVNKTTAERYVNSLDFSKSGWSDELIGKVLEAPAQELVLRGKLGKKESKFGTRPFLVYEAYRGLPGVEPLAGDRFYSAKDRDPQIQCFTAPCPNEMARELNTTKQYAFDGYSVSLAALPHVDQDWLADRINHHNAIVAAWIIDGDKFPGGHAQILDASQVYLDVRDMMGPCPAFKLAACPEGQTWTWTRNDDLCQMPNACTVDDGSCPSLVPPQCAEGYTLSGWRTDSKSCIRFACDPSFVMSP